MYRLLRRLLFFLAPEAAHNASIWFLRLLVATAPIRAAAGRIFRATDPVLRVRALGKDFENPIGIAAGFDKDAVAFEGLGVLGFGHVEVGTLTPRPQAGNPKPRLFRLPADRALVNRMGFNNEGADRARARLRARRSPSLVIGANVGKNKTTPNEQAAEDYVDAARILAPYVDYLVINVSSPNTPELRKLQGGAALEGLLCAVRDALSHEKLPRRVPVLVKIAPDLTYPELDEIAELVLRLGIDGIIATNTTTSRENLSTPEARVARCGDGGLSGAPLAARSLDVLRHLRRRVGSGSVLVSVGGIETGEDAWQRILAGATLVQVYTGFVYEGPGLARRIALDLARRTRAAGYESITEAIGAERAG